MIREITTASSFARLFASRCIDSWVQAGISMVDSGKRSFHNISPIRKHHCKMWSGMKLILKVNETIQGRFEEVSMQTHLLVVHCREQTRIHWQTSPPAFKEFLFSHFLEIVQCQNIFHNEIKAKQQTLEAPEDQVYSLLIFSPCAQN